MGTEELIKRRDKRHQELKDIVLQINEALQNLESMKNQRERLIGTIAELNEQIEEYQNGKKPKEEKVQDIDGKGN